MSAAREQRRTANAVQQHWLERLAARVPSFMTRVRDQIERSRAWLVANPDQTLGAFDRAALLRLDEKFEAEDAALGLPEARWPAPVIASERPTVVRWDDAKPARLHCEDCPALAYADGWKVFAWHGMRVSEQLITDPGSITVKQINAEDNAEVRRVMLERFGYGRYIESTGAEVLDKDQDALGFPRTLFRISPKEDSEDLPIVILKVFNSSLEPDGTRKIYHLRVHPEIRPLIDDEELGPPQDPTCQNAVGSLFGLTGAEYAPAVET